MSSYIWSVRSKHAMRSQTSWDVQSGTSHLRCRGPVTLNGRWLPCATPTQVAGVFSSKGRSRSRGVHDIMFPHLAMPKNQSHSSWGHTQPSGVKIWWKNHDWNNGGRLKPWKNSPEVSHSPWYSPLMGGIPMVSALKTACLARFGRNFGCPLQREEEVWSGSAGFPRSKGAKAMFLLGCFMWYQRDPM